LAIDALSNVARAHALAGRLREAARTCHEALGVFGESHPPATGIAHVTLAEILHEWNELAAAAEHVEQGVQLGTTCGIVEMALHGYLTMARVKRAQGQPEAALEALNRADRLAQRWNFVRVVNLVGARRAELSLALGDLDEASRWADSFLKMQMNMPGYLPELEELTAIRILIAQAASPRSEVIERLRRLLPAARQANRVSSVIRIRTLQALAFQTAGKPEEARLALRDALALAQPEGYIRTFVDDGPAMLALLHQYAWTDANVKDKYLRKLLSAARSGDSSVHAVVPGSTLSWRELEVLQLLPTHLDTAEIAQHLIVSVNTVKTHLKHVYRKLGVNDRSGAVLRAQQLNLL
jgi:LuxR family transcriptional regulator, maltose regulon positive regulatory protein